MFVFSHPTFAFFLNYCITREYGNQYFIVISRPCGLLERREYTYLNVSTPPSSNSLPLSPRGRPYIWIDSNIDRMNTYRPYNALNAILEAEPGPIFKLTGRKQLMSHPTGVGWEDKGEREIQEVELLLSEDDLAHWCNFCHKVETDGNGVKFQRIRGEGYNSEYGCGECLFASREFLN